MIKSPRCHLYPSVSPQDWTHPPSHPSPPRWPWTPRRRSQPRPQVRRLAVTHLRGKLCPLCPLVTQPGHAGVLPCMGDVRGVTLPMAGSCQGAAVVLVDAGTNQEVGGAGAAGAGSGPPQCPRVPTLVPAVTDSRDQPSQATEVVTTTLLTIEQESKCAAAAGPARGSIPLGESLHIPRAHPMPPALLPCPQRSPPHVPSAQSMPQESSHIPRVYSILPGCSPHATQGFIPHLQGSLHAHSAHPMLLGNHPMYPVSPHSTRTPPVSPGAQLTSPQFILCSPGVIP